MPGVAQVVADVEWVVVDGSLLSPLELLGSQVQQPGKLPPEVLALQVVVGGDGCFFNGQHSKLFR